MIYYNTINDSLHSTLLTLMESPEFMAFRLVGGTALSLQLGHRLSVDIDLFTDAPYGSINFKELDAYIEDRFPYYHHFSNIDPAIGKSYRIGKEEDFLIKVDVFYTDPFIDSPVFADGIRMATIEEIIAMKLDVVQRGGRKKDFWDLHELLLHYNISKMLNLHKARYPYFHDEKLILQNLNNFEMAENDFNPVCLRGKYWEFIKDDIENILKSWKSE